MKNVEGKPAAIKIKFIIFPFWWKVIFLGFSIMVLNFFETEKKNL
jgi:hypothetical protein